MERENGKVKIQGVSPSVSQTINRNTSNRKAIIESECRISEYFESIHYREDEPMVAFAPNSIFIGSKVVNSPRYSLIIPAIQVEIANEWSAHRVKFYPPAETIDESQFRTRRQKCIVYKFDHHKYYKAFFFTESKTLVIGDLTRARNSAYRYLNFIINNLVERGMLTRSVGETTQEERPQESTRRTVEIHDGEKVFVNVPVNWKKCTVGCDPEFEYVTNGDVVSMPPRSRYNSTDARCEVGIDGAGAQIEFRPKAFEDERQVVSYLKGIMSTISDHLSTRGDIYPLGGHIHVGVVDSYDVPNDLKWLMDYFVGKPTIDLSGNARSSYKALAYDGNRGVEAKRWGFEYRVPPAAIFEYPEFARLAMKAVKNITECFINCMTIVVNADAPKFEDYFNYCHFTPREYERWQMYIDRYKDFMGNANGYQRNVIQNWMNDTTVAVIRPENTAREVVPEAVTQPMESITGVVFQDEWHTGVRRLFENEVCQWLRNTDTRVTVNFFGLSASRGNVTYGYNVDCATRIANEGRWQGFGVPRAVRMGDVTEEEINTHIFSVLCELQRILDEFNGR